VRARHHDQEGVRAWTQGADRTDGRLRLLRSRVGIQRRGLQRAVITPPTIPKPTTYSRASHTLSQEVWNGSAVSFQENLRVQQARKSVWALVDWCLPLLEGTSSTTTPQVRHWTRRTFPERGSVEGRRRRE